MLSIVPIKLKISTAYLVSSAKPILVDTGSPREGAKIIAALARENLRLKDLALLLHTHGHSDHCGSTAELKTIENISAAVHPADAEMMRRGRNGPLKPTRFFSRILLPFVNVPFPPVEPDLLASEEFSLASYGMQARIVATPGHTAGSLSIVFEDGRAIIGDLFMGGYLGGLFRSREPDYHYYAEDLGELRKSIQKLLDLGVKMFLPGHGGPLDRKDVIARFALESRPLAWQAR